MRSFRGLVCLMVMIVLVFAAGNRSVAQSQMQSWQDVKRNGGGTVTVYWYESRPFIYRTSLGMAGIEYELLEGFRAYLKAAHQVDLQFNWEEARSFGDTYDHTRNAQHPGVFGVSAFSITPERKREVEFSPPYMSDISVLITSRNIPIVETSDEFNRVFARLTAITIRATTYEQDIFQLRERGKLNFGIEYIPSSENILAAIEARDSAFGFIDLPVYMMIFNQNPSVNVKRQNFFPVKREGYAFIYPKNSDWNGPMHEYFASAQFNRSLEAIIGKYIDIGLYQFVEKMSIQSNDLVALLTKEKEIQYEDLVGKSKQIAMETQALGFLIALLVIIFIFMTVIIVQYRKRSQQQAEIESQRHSIALQNEQLARRNHHLVTLDEEKNNLIRILAHDLRTPINQVQGLAQLFLLDNESLPDEQKTIIRKIMDASVRLNKMITNILDLDALENDRVSIYLEPVALGPLVSQVTKTFDRQAEKKNIRLTDMISSDGWIKGDPLSLTQVFENLISNALKFSPGGSQVQVCVSEERDRVRVEVKDSGPGLTEEDMSLLFKKFQRLSAKPTDGENSTGLGLSIVKKYVELMGGRVWCVSEYGYGANFIVEFEKSKED